MQLAHLIHQGIEISIRICHFFRDLVETRKLSEGIGSAHTNVFNHRLGVIQFRFLHKDPDGVSGAETSLAVAGLIQSCHDLEDRGLTGTVGTDHTDLSAGEESHCDVIKDDFVTNSFASLNHLVDELRHGFSVQDHVT